MRFVAISDTHGLHDQLKLPHGDVILHAGDVSKDGKADELTDFLDWFAALPFQHKIFIAGNHDFLAAEQPEVFAEMIPEGVTYLNDSGIQLDQLHIWGSPVQPNMRGWAFGRDIGPDIARHWDMIPEGVDILLTHTPPYGMLDKMRNGQAIGCRDLRRKLSSLQPKVNIFGHVHAGYGESRVDGIHFINAACMKSGAGLVNPPVSFEW